MIGGVIANNTLQGPGSVTEGVYKGANGGYAVELWDGYGLTVSGNTVRGFESALNRRTAATSTGGSGLALTGNTVQHCNYGIALVNPGSATIMGNIMQENVHPMLVGQGLGSSKPVVIVGNHANGCKFPMEIGGALVVVADGTVSTGTGKSLNVKSLGLNLPAGTAVAFSGGATITLSGAATAGATSLAGTVSGGAVASGEFAMVTGLAHSLDPIDNHRTILGNADSTAGTY
jgi:parallel beta-helix repeat protein